MKFNHTTNFWTEYLVLYIAPKEKIQWGYVGGARGRFIQRPSVERLHLVE
jgi:hypothetical protein